MYPYTLTKLICIFSPETVTEFWGQVYSSSIKNPFAHLYFVHNNYARFQKDPLKTAGGVDYTVRRTKGQLDIDRQTDRRADRGKS